MIETIILETRKDLAEINRLLDEFSNTNNIDKLKKAKAYLFEKVILLSELNQQYTKTIIELNLAIKTIEVSNESISE